ncbi:helix-turn-helix domain-containing protein [Clostridioides difficile]|uniref:helix-turn-helix domain-containing protein n=1 Tax=Clostridioides difficile TaxID=1496 RepID=UPI002FE6CC99
MRPLREIRKEFECEYIEKVLSLCGNNISNTAKKLEISRRQLTNKISEYNIK